MKILFDLLCAQPAGGWKFHGGGEYAKTVFKRMLELNEDSEIIVFYDEKLFLDEWLLNLIEEKKIKNYNVLSYYSLESIVEREGIDIVYFGIASSVPYLRMNETVRKIGTIHDLRTLELKVDKYALMTQYGKSFMKALVKYLFWPFFLLAQKKRFRARVYSLDTIVTVSGYSQNAILREYYLAKDRITTYYSPRKFKCSITERCKEYENLKLGKFILLLGLDRYEKNPYRAIQAIEELLDLHELDGYKIVCTGNPSKHVTDLMKHRDRYLVLGYVSTECLENLYAHCDVFLYPSLNEGFGYPPIEAMAYGRTCAVSATSSIPEVCGHVVHYFNPLDVHSIADGILRAVKEKIDPGLIKEHLDKINKRQDEDLDKLCHLILSGGKSLG